MSDNLVSRESDKFMLRMPDGMRDRIKRVADRSGRSMNAEIVAALETMFPRAPPVEELLKELRSNLDQLEQADDPQVRFNFMSSITRLYDYYWSLRDPETQEIALVATKNENFEAGREFERDSAKAKSRKR